MDLSIIIPCYNEAENVPKLKRELFPIIVGLAQSQSVEVIFVDDGSRDNTWQALTDTFGPEEEIPVRLAQHEVNRGLGAAIRTGFAAARGEVIVTTDSDGTYSFSEIPRLLNCLTPEVDIVTASPYHPAGGIEGVPAYRLLLSQGSSTIYRLLSSREIHTYTALFRAYRREVIETVPFESNGFLAGTELLVNGLRMGYRVAEYPAVLHSRAYGQSKAKIARTIQAHLNFQIRTLLPWQPYGAVIKGSSDSVYLYTEGKKRLFPSSEIFLSHGYIWEQILQVNDDYLATLPDGPPMRFRNGTLLRGPDNTIYVTEYNRKRPISSAELFENLGYRWDNILPVSGEALNDLETGAGLTAADDHPDGTIVKSPASEFAYLLEEGKKRWFPSPQVFLSWGYKWDQIVTISKQELDSYPTGTPITPQKSFYLKDIQEAIVINVRADELPTENLLSKLPQLIDGLTKKKKIKELPGVNTGQNIIKAIF